VNDGVVVEPGGLVPRKESFNAVAERYDRSRPGYPDELVKDLVQLAELRPGSRVLEIGCGTGQLTVPLAGTGSSIVAVELGDRLAQLARHNLAGFKRVSVVNSAFEDWALPDEPFDCVVSATAFHWLDAGVRLVKSAQALRAGDAIAIITTHHIAGGTSGFDDACQPCYTRWTGADPDFRLPTADDVESDEELQRSDLFDRVARRRYVRELPYPTQRLADLLGTFSPHLALSPEARTGLIDCLSNLVDSEFDGRVTLRYLNELQVAAKVN
jgi:SAM-dependent methyltransferase